MRPEDQSDRLVVVGFVGDYQDSASSIGFYRPVLTRLGGIDEFVPLVEDWSELDLKVVSSSEKQYVNYLSGTEVQFVSAGLGVIIAGAGFYNRCARLPGLEQYGTSIQTRWNVLNGPYSLRIADRATFNDINNGIWNRGVAKLYDALYSTPAKTAGLASDYFRVIQSLGVDLESSWRPIAIYHHEVRDLESYELWRQVTVAANVVESEGEFDQQVEGAINWLQRERLSEGAESRRFEDFFQSVFDRSSHGTLGLTGFRSASGLLDRDLEQKIDLYRLLSTLETRSVSADQGYLEERT